MPISGKLKRTLSLARDHGVRHTASRVLERQRERRDYAKWVKRFGSLGDTDRDRIREDIKTFGAAPLISVVMPVYDVEETWLGLAVESVRRQLYPNWELCIADDRSRSAHVRRVLTRYAEIDARIRVVFRAENGHISAASNSALELATGEFVVLLDHDDELTEDALYHVARELNTFPETEMIYSDEDTIDEKGRRYFPRFKPDFSRDLFYSVNLVTHLSAYKTTLLRELGGFRLGLEGSQDYDLALRAVERIPESGIRHIPRILYHWRAIRTSAAHSRDAKPYAYERAREALCGHFERTGIMACVEPAVLNLNRVRYEMVDRPKIALIVFGGETPATNVQKIRDVTAYPTFEILHTGKLPATASVLNEAAAKTGGEVLCFLNAEFLPLAGDWLEEMVSFAMQEKIGVVGAKMLDAHGTIISAGSIIGQNGTAGPAHYSLPRADHGNFVRAQLVGNYSAVSGGYLVTRRAIFEAVGGFDAANLENKLFAADYCLRLGRAGYRVAYTPYAELARSTKKEKPDRAHTVAEEYEYFVEKWAAEIERDPFYNPNFKNSGPSFRIKT